MWHRNLIKKQSDQKITPGFSCSSSRRPSPATTPHDPKRQRLDDHLAQKLPSLDETPSPRTPPVRRSSTEALTKLASASSARMPTEARAKEAELLEEALATSPVPPRKDQTNARASAAKQEARVHKGPPKAKEPKHKAPLKARASAAKQKAREQKAPPKARKKNPTGFNSAAFGPLKLTIAAAQIVHSVPAGRQQAQTACCCFGSILLCTRRPWSTWRPGSVSRTACSPRPR